MDILCKYDIQSVNWRQVRDILRRLGDADHEEDWSDGRAFPWWVWLANTGTLRDVANDGIYRVCACVSRGVKAVVVNSISGTYWLTSERRTGRMQVTPPPRLYQQ